MKSTKEIWKQIPGYEKYEASTLGRIRSYKNKYIIGLVKSKKGYSRVKYYMGVEYSPSFKTLMVAHIILKTFIGDRPSSIHEASHLNSIKTDNRLDNLNWETPIENLLRRVIKDMEYISLSRKEIDNIKLLLKKIKRLLR